MQRGQKISLRDLFGEARMESFLSIPICVARPAMPEVNGASFSVSISFQGIGSLLLLVINVARSEMNKI